MIKLTQTKILLIFVFLCIKLLNAQTFTSSFIQTGEGCTNLMNCMAKNSANEIFAFWRDGSQTNNNSQYYILKWDNTSHTWSQMSTFNMTPLSAQTAFDHPQDDVSMAIDASGGYHVAFGAIENAACCGQKRGIVYGYSANGSSWTFKELQILSDPNGWLGTDDPTLKLDGSGRPHIVYKYSDVNGSRVNAVEHRWFDGATWQFETIVSQTGASNEINAPDFDISPNGDLHVAVVRELNGSGTDGALWYAKKLAAGGAWTLTEILPGATGAAASTVMSIAALPSGFINIINRNNSGAITEVSNASGSWINSAIGAGITGTINTHSFSVNGNGDKILSYKATSSSTYSYAIKLSAAPTWTIGGTIYADANTNVARYNSILMNNAGNIVTLFDRLPAGGSCNASNQREMWSAYAQALVSSPSITTSGTLTSFTTCAGTASSSQSFTVSGSNLTANLVVSAPNSNFEVSLSSGSGYSSSLSLIPSGGTVNNTTIFVRLSTTATGSPSGNVSCTSTGAATQNISVSGTVNTLSVAPTSITGASTICSGGSTTLTVSGGSLGTGATIQWFTGSCGGTSAGTGTSITVSPSSNTTYFVRYNGTCNTTTCASQVVTVNTISVAPTGITGVTTICSGGSTTLTVTGGTMGTGATIEWFTGSCGGTAAGTGNSITVSPSSNTTYFVRYNGTCNTTLCASTTVTVNSLSVAPTGITGVNTICSGGSTTLTVAGGTMGTGATIEWFTGSCGGTSAGTGFLHLQTQLIL